MTRFCKRRVFAVVLGMIAAGIFGGCGANGPASSDAGPDAGQADGDTDNPDADSQSDSDTNEPPMILSFGTNVSDITEGESVTFTAVVSDPDGIDDLIGGALKSPDGTVVYGAFATSAQEGAYTLTITWNAVDQAQSIEFTGEDTRTFLAEFFDISGHTVVEQVTIQLYCDTGAACDGKCVDLSTSSNNCGACRHACAVAGGCSSGACYEWSSCTEVGDTCDDICASEGRTCAVVCFGSDLTAPRAVLHYMDINACISDPGSGSSLTSVRYCDEPVFVPAFPFWTVEQCCCSTP
ncbi:MAG: hypothetical protein JRJ87_24610 [Deltaproteobacteria bacterium]|nr:hypothetical protein [Deltaproteobacteria bacterium]